MRLGSAWHGRKGRKEVRIDRSEGPELDIFEHVNTEKGFDLISLNVMTQDKVLTPTPEGK